MSATSVKRNELIEKIIQCHIDIGTDIHANEFDEYITDLIHTASDSDLQYEINYLECNSANNVCEFDGKREIIH